MLNTVSAELPRASEHTAYSNGSGAPLAGPPGPGASCAACAGHGLGTARGNPTGRAPAGSIAKNWKARHGGSSADVHAVGAPRTSTRAPCPLEASATPPRPIGASAPYREFLVPFVEAYG